MVGVLWSPALTHVAVGQGNPGAETSAPITANPDKPAAAWAMSVQVKVLEERGAAPVAAANVAIRKIGSERHSYTDPEGVVVITGAGEGEVDLQIMALGVPPCHIKIPAPKALLSVLVDKTAKGTCTLGD
jgi:hypothetical protein